MRRLEGKRALVTGASRGIGQAIACAFAAAGADVAITARHADALRDTAAQIEATEQRAYPLAWDVADVSQMDARLAEVAQHLGGLDILVNNAGVLRKDRANPPLAEEEWDYIMDVNLKGLFYLCHGAARVMAEQRHGVIINIASDAGLRAAAHPYGISKWGVIGLTQGLAKACARDGIRVNAIAPGPVATEMMNWQPDKPMDAPNLPLGRYALPEEVSRVAVFLASEDAVAVFGQAIVVNSANG
jgi:NAD(P)-dependent dehydrogenase (short-subunit alcohol dehydrogenase family)